MLIGNLFADAAPPADGERCETLLSLRNLVVERIVSSNTIARQEYVQAQDEWVVLLKGDAVLEVAGDRVALGAGDYVLLPAGTAHSVREVSEGAIWLAVHLYR
jgi:cupin 2 domain-containing protein